VPVITQEKIDINKLKTQDQIVHYNEVFLFEDELGDNGSSNLNVRVVIPIPLSSPLCPFSLSFSLLSFTSFLNIFLQIPLAGYAQPVFRAFTLLASCR
jgi:hypothetical protein